jgi:hypothetical protein
VSLTCRRHCIFDFGIDFAGQVIAIQAKEHGGIRDGCVRLDDEDAKHFSNALSVSREEVRNSRHVCNKSNFLLEWFVGWLGRWSKLGLRENSLCQKGYL